MALLGFHIVFSLISFTVYTKLKTKFSISQFIFDGLCRYVGSVDRTKTKALPSSNTKNRKRKPDRNNEGNSLVDPDFSLVAVPVSVKETSLLPWYTTVCWLTDYFPFAILMYCCSETYCYFYPGSQAINISVIWILLLIGFSLEALTSMTSSLFFGDAVEGERNVIVSFAALFFLFSMMFLMFAESFFDIGFKEAFETFTKTASEFFAATDFPEAAIERSPLLLFISLSLFFAFLGAMLVFPNFRYARMYAGAVKDSRPVLKLMYHLVFLSQSLSVLLFVHPVKNYLLFGPRKLLTLSQLNSMRVWSVVLTMMLRILFRRGHLQSHLDLAFDALADIRSQSRSITLNDAQKIISRYFSYINVAALQYFVPELLSLTFALLLKTLGNYSWVGKETAYAEVKTSSESLASLAVLLGPVVQRGIWTLFLVVTLLFNHALGFIGVVYNNYF